MKKYIIGAFLLSLASSLFSQKPVFFEQKEDTIIFYLSCNGRLIEKDKATYKRISFFENNRLAFCGNVVDYYYPKGTIALRARYQNGLYEGHVINYYKTGTIRETGNYKSQNRDSIWTFYYNNEKLEKKINYGNTQQKLIEYYKKNGKPIFLDGNGMYKGYLKKDYFSCEQYLIKGELKDGVMDGRWTINLNNSISTEVFENGKFIRGHETPHNRTYEDASLINPTGFTYYENIALLDYLIACNKSGFYWPTYNKKNIEKDFLVELEQKIIEKINITEFFYALIEFQLDNGIINSNSFKSVTNDKKKADELKDLILSLNKWDMSNEKLSFTIYLPVFWENGVIYLKPDDIIKFN